DLVGVRQGVSDGKLDGGQPIEPDGDRGTFPAENVGEFFLCLDEPGQALRGDRIAARFAPADERTHALQALLDQNLVGPTLGGAQVWVGVRPAVQLDPDLARDAFDTPEVRAVRVLQLNRSSPVAASTSLISAFTSGSQASSSLSVGCRPRSLSRSLRLTEMLGMASGQYCTRLERIISRSAEKRSLMPWSSSSHIAMRAR